MNSRNTALISTISNTFCDFTLDIAINKYNTYSVLLFTCVFSTIIQIISATVLGISITIISIPMVLAYGICILCGYLSYIESLKKLPIGLTSLLESGGLFVVLIIDIILGYLKVTPYFIIMFTTFVISVVIFTIETNRTKEKIKFKKIKLSGLVFIGLSIFLYSIEPYMIKIASSQGANEIAINMGYNLIAIIYFSFKFLSNRKEERSNEKTDNKNIRNRFIIICLLIGIFESVYYIFGTMSYINETPTIVNVISELRVFLLIILSGIFKTDKITAKKVISMILGIASVIGIYLM